MAAIIETRLYSGGIPVPGAPVVTGQSRDDLRSGYEIRCHSVQAATTYQWTLSFIPTSPGSNNPATPNTGTQSTATLAGATLQDATFFIDWEGAYLLRLTVDAGLPTEDTQFVRLRYLTKFADLKLVAAGERRDSSGVVPVDADPTAWANDQNQNIQRLMLLVRRLSTSGRTLYVDANRGRDHSNAQDDESNLVYLPGTDTANSEETGTKFGAEGFADFSLINDAINYAAAAAARGEAAPSFDDPYWIVIQPGYYQEDLVLQEHIHLIGVEAGISEWMNGATFNYTSAVIIENTAGGTGYHTFTGTAGLDSPLLFQNLMFLNNQDQTAALIQTDQGVLYFDRCQVICHGAHATQGPLVRCQHASNEIGVFATDCVFWSDGPTMPIIVDVDGLNALGRMERCIVQSAATTAINFNRTLYAATGALQFLQCTLPDIQAAANVYIYESTTGDITIDDFAGGALAAAITLGLHDVRCENIVFDTINMAGVTTLIMADVSYQADGDSHLSLPNGAPTNLYRRGSHGESHPYQNDYAPPEDTGDIVPVANQLPANYDNFQRALDYLIRVVHPVAGSPYYSLSTAYDGLAAMYPITYGTGLGRTITADDGAVQIAGNPAPTEPRDAQLGVKDGGLQMEGILDIGPIITPGTPATDTNTDVGPTEIQLNPSPGNGGPLISMGRSLYPNDISTTDQDRGLPGAVVRAYHTTAATPEFYHLHLRSVASQNDVGSQLAHVIVQAATSTRAGARDAGHAIIGAGHNYGGGAGAPGRIYLAPGTSTQASAGLEDVYIVGLGSTFATLIAELAFGGGQSGTFWVACPYGVESFDVDAGDALGDVATTINNESDYFLAADDGGKLRITFMEPGPHGDVLYVTDDQAGALNTALGNLATAGGAAVFTAGAWGNTVGLSCPADGVLEVHGSIISGGAPIGPYTQVVGGPTTYTAQATDEIIGCLTTGGTVQINLPNTFSAGTKMVVKDEDGNAGASNITLAPQGGALIDGAVSFPIAANYAAASVYFNGTDWFIF